MKSYPRAEIASRSCDLPLHFLPADSRGEQEGIGLPDLLYLRKFHPVTLKSVTCLTKLQTGIWLGLKTSRDGKCMTSSPGSQSLHITPTVLLFFSSLMTAMPTGLMKLSMQQQYGLNFVSRGFYPLS